MKDIIKFHETIGINLGDDFSYYPEKKPKITVVMVINSYWAALYVDGELKTDCSDGEGYVYGEVLKAINLDYKTLEITKDELNNIEDIFPTSLKTLKEKIKDYKKIKNPEMDPYGEEDW